MSGVLPQAGTIGSPPLPALLLALHETRFSGALLLSRDRIEKRVLLREGVPLLAESNRPAESLTQRLVASGTLSPEAAEQVAEHVAQRGGREEAALLALRLLPPRELVDAMRDAAQARVVDCFAWPEGSFRLDPAAAPPEGTAAFELDTLALVREGITRWPLERLLAALGTALSQWPERGERWDAVAARFEASEADALLLAALDGSRATGSLLAGGPTPHALALIWVLRATGALRFVAEPKAEAAEASPDEKEAPPELEAAELEIVIRGQESASEARPAAAGAANDPKQARKAKEAAALREEVLEKHAKLEELDHYALLGVAQDAGAAQVKRAYVLAAKRFHPDALARLGLKDLDDAANEVFAAIARAQDVLSDPERRADYDAGIGSGTIEEAERAGQAEALYRKGQVLMKAGQFAPALQLFESAVDLWPEEADYQSALGWALFKKTPPDLERAYQHLAHAVTLAPEDPEARHRLALVQREMGPG